MISCRAMPRVLIVEAEPLVRGFIQASLTKSGFEVVHVGNCIQPDAPHDCALQCYSGFKPPHVVIAAVVSPRLCSGIEVAAKALCLWTGVKVLLISSTPADLWPSDARSMLANLPVGLYSFLAKPFTSDDLQAAVAGLTAGVRDSVEPMTEVGLAVPNGISRSCAETLRHRVRQRSVGAI
jgi:CheY-like chemotaxis protein